MLKINNLSANVDNGNKQIINNLSLAVPAGEVHAIMGPNGAGKSTLSYVLTGKPGYEVTVVMYCFLGNLYWIFLPRRGPLKGYFYHFNTRLKYPAFQQ